MLLSSALLAGMAAVVGEKLPSWPRLVRHLLAGMLLNGTYLCTSWWAISRGMPAGVMALLGALQPLVVAAASFCFLGERLAMQAWIGLALGLIGVGMVLAPLLTHVDHGTISYFVAVGAVMSIFSMAAGTMVQRGQINDDPIRISGAIQNVGGSMIAAVATIAVGDYRWDGSVSLWLGLLWTVFSLTAGALSLLVWMTRHQGPTRVSALLLLVPPLAASEAWILFGERLVPVQLAGFLLALGGVLLMRMDTTLRCLTSS